MSITLETVVGLVVVDTPPPVTVDVEAVTGAEVVVVATGPPGPPGLPGADGADGPPGPTYVPPPESDANSNTYYGVGTPADLKGSTNTAVGTSALFSNVSGVSNMAIGYGALHNNTSGGLNVGIGNTALFGVTTGAQNVGIGHAAGHSNIATTTQNFQTFVGSAAEQYVTGSGDRATAIGYAARAHSGATAIGSLSEARGVKSIAIGNGAIATADDEAVVGTAVTAVKIPGTLWVAGKQVVGAGPESDAQKNTNYGLNAMPTPGAAFESTAVGEGAMRQVTSGQGTAVGYLALGAVTNATESTAVGGQSGLLATGTALTLIGHGTGYYPVDLGASNQATLVGAYACSYTAGGGTQATALGFQSRAAIAGTALGALAQARGLYSTAVGHGAVATADNQIMLGTAAERVDIPGSLKVAGSPVWKAWSGTQAAYDAIGTKDPGTLYVVVV